MVIDAEPGSVSPRSGLRDLRAPDKVRSSEGNVSEPTTAPEQLGRYELVTKLATGPDDSVMRAFFEDDFQRFQDELDVICCVGIGVVRLNNCESALLEDAK